MSEGRLSDDVVAHFTEKLRRQDGSVVERCTCTDVEPEWQGGEHLVSNVPGTKEVRVHFYPDELTGQVIVLRIMGRE